MLPSWASVVSSWGTARAAVRAKRVKSSIGHVLAELLQLAAGEVHRVARDGRQLVGELGPLLAGLALPAQLVGDGVDLVGEPVEPVLQGRGGQDGGHDWSSSSLPAIDISAGSGSSLPGSRMFQYIQRNITLPQWLSSVSFSRLNGPIPGSGYLPGSGSVS